MTPRLVLSTQSSSLSYYTRLISNPSVLKAGMGSTGGLFYLTADAGSSGTTSAIDLLKWVKECSKVSQIPGAEGANVYRATDSTGAGKAKPEWLVMWEINDASCLSTDHLKTAEMPGPGTPRRQDLFSVQSTYSIPSFSSADLRNETAANFIVAVIIVLDEALKAEYDAYYEEEHIGALMRVPGWRRTRRFVEARSDGSEPTRQGGEVKILQLHDYDPENYGIEGQEFKSATSTRWYKDMMANAVKSKDRRTYELCGFVEV